MFSSGNIASHTTEASGRHIVNATATLATTLKTDALPAVVCGLAASVRVVRLRMAIRVVQNRVGIIRDRNSCCVIIRSIGG